MWNTLPLFGTALILGVLVLAAYTFSVSAMAAATGRARQLVAARFGAYGTVALILTGVLTLAYAFISHDFRLRYVAHYSDRSMPVGYLLTALWGGQDGSLLWWLFLLAGYIFVCVKWLGRRYVELQPVIIATLMTVVMFFAVLMLFAANPFATSIAGARADGEGLNPLLLNFYMIIHPPSLYMGFVGCTIPFAFAVAALVTGRLDTEWIRASRKFMLFAWVFLSIGNTLGMLWAYEELGWGGYWAWDPVENAAFFPWLSASAYVHSVMLQERRGMLKVWNVSLVSITFFLTIFGTFLTRSGAIASVHSFAQSSIGSYFLWFLAGAIVITITLVLYRWPELRNMKPTPELRVATLATGWFTILVIGAAGWIAYQLPTPWDATSASPGAAASAMSTETIAQLAEKRTILKVMAFALLVGGGVYAASELVFRRLTRETDTTAERPAFESIFSRELTFLLNNWALLGFLVFVVVATVFPMLSEAFWDEKVTVGPPYFNAWVQPIGLTIFALMGMGSLFGWRKSSPDALRRALRIPLAAFVLAMALHFAIGERIGYPATAFSEPIYGGTLGVVLRAFNGVTPVLGVSLAAFNAAVIIQEFAMLILARRRSGASEETPKFLWYLGFFPGLLYTLASLPPASRRRYGGYVVHFGVVLMFIGFTGKSWTIDRETTLSPGQSIQVKDYELTYLGPRMEVDPNKRMVFADVAVTQKGDDRGHVSPAKFIYKKMPESPTTEVAMLHSLRDDLYVVVGAINPSTKTASFQVHVNPLVPWIWIGCVVLIFGSVVCMWPELQPSESRAWGVVRGSAAVASSVMLGVLLALMPTTAFAQSASSLHAGTVHIDDENERDLFKQLRCMCGDCARDLLSTCACQPAAETRDELRAQLRAGMTHDEIISAYVERYGSEALAVPPNVGALRAIYSVPLVAIFAGGIGGAFLVRRWRRRARDRSPGSGKFGDDGDSPGGVRDDGYDDELDRELRDLDF